MSRPSYRAAIDAKCRDCGGQEGGKHSWRKYTSICTVISCPLWQVRPLASRNVPAWLASRDPDDLPENFLSLNHQQAFELIGAPEGVLHRETANNSQMELPLLDPEGYDDD